MLHSLLVDHSASMAHFPTQQSPSAPCISTPVTGLGASNSPCHSLIDEDGILSGADISSDLDSNDSDIFFGSDMSFLMKSHIFFITNIITLAGDWYSFSSPYKLGSCYSRCTTQNENRAESPSPSIHCSLNFSPLGLPDQCRRSS